MKFASTRNINDQVSLRDAIFQGLAPDGGLYLPMEEPNLKHIFLSSGPRTGFAELAGQMLNGLFPQDFGLADALRICKEAFPFEPRLEKIADAIYLLELFHGPSCAFKDYGASFLATIMQEYLRAANQRALILTATSGDTGSAVAQACFGKGNIDVVILYPSGRVSPSQEMQLTTVGGNVHALEVKGNFDDCQRMVKEAFLDPALRSEFPLSSANSINLGRLIPQSFYYAWAFAQIKQREPGELYFCVPSGNFGNLTAGILAWRWGLPVKGFIAATNANDVVPEYLAKGAFNPRASVATLSNAMDVGHPSNFERLQSIFNHDLTRMRAMIHPAVVSDADTRAVMKRYHEGDGRFLCPHTAVGVKAAEVFRDCELETVGCATDALGRKVDKSGRLLAGDATRDGAIITLSTAHPGKFSEVVKEATGVEPEIPPRLAEYMKRQKKATLIGNTLAELAAFMRGNLAR
jgi:threonine synthase